MIDDELVKVLMGGLSYGHMLTHLDLSHNKIGDRGARRLASLLDPDYCINALDLSDNQVHANGCMHLGAHLAENETCSTLNLRLNRCEDNGVSHLFQDMCVNKYLKTLNISCNDLTVRCLPYMNSMLSENTTLMELDLSANPLYQADLEENAFGAGGDPGASRSELHGGDSVGGAIGASSLDGTGMDGTLSIEDSLGGINMNSQFGIFARCVIRSTSLLRVDIRQCGLPPELSEKITTTVKHRELVAKGIPVDAYEKSKIQQMEEEQKEAAAEAAAAEGEENAELVEGEIKEGAEGEQPPAGEEGEEAPPAEEAA